MSSSNSSESNEEVTVRGKWVDVSTSNSLNAGDMYLEEYDSDNDDNSSDPFDAGLDKNVKNPDLVRYLPTHEPKWSEMVEELQRSEDIAHTVANSLPGRTVLQPGTPLFSTTASFPEQRWDPADLHLARRCLIDSKKSDRTDIMLGRNTGFYDFPRTQDNLFIKHLKAYNDVVSPLFESSLMYLPMDPTSMVLFHCEELGSFSDSPLSKFVKDFTPYKGIRPQVATRNDISRCRFGDKPILIFNSVSDFVLFNDPSIFDPNLVRPLLEKSWCMILSVDPYVKAPIKYGSIMREVRTDNTKVRNEISFKDFEYEFVDLNKMCLRAYFEQTRPGLNALVWRHVSTDSKSSYAFRLSILSPAALQNHQSPSVTVFQLGLKRQDKTKHYFTTPSVLRKDECNKLFSEPDTLLDIAVIGSPHMPRTHLSVRLKLHYPYVTLDVMFNGSIHQQYFCRELSATSTTDNGIYYILYKNLKAITNQTIFYFDGAIVQDKIELWDFANDDTRPSSPQQVSLAMNFLASLPVGAFNVFMPRPFETFSPESHDYWTNAYSLVFSSWRPFSVQLPSVPLSSSLMLRVTDLKSAPCAIRYMVIPEHINFTVTLRMLSPVAAGRSFGIGVFKLSLRKINDTVLPCAKKNIFVLSKPRHNYPELFSQMGFTGNRLESLRSRPDVLEFKSDANDIYKCVSDYETKDVKSTFVMPAPRQKILSVFAQSFKKGRTKINCLIMELSSLDPQVKHFLERPCIGPSDNPGVVVTKEPFYNSIVRDEFHTRTTLGYVRDGLATIDLASKFPYSYKMFQKNFLVNGSFIHVPDKEAKDLDAYLLCCGMDNIPDSKQDFLRAYDNYRINRRSISLHVPLTEMALIIDALFYVCPLPKARVHEKEVHEIWFEDHVKDMTPYMMDVDGLLRTIPAISRSGSTSFLMFLQLHPEFLPSQFRLSLIDAHKNALDDRWCIWLTTGVQGPIPPNSKHLKLVFPGKGGKNVIFEDSETSGHNSPGKKKDRTHPYKN